MLLALIVGGGLHAQAEGDDALAALREQVSRLHTQGRYADAIPLAERYVSLARLGHGEEHAEYAAAIDWLGLIYKAQGRYGEAEPLLQRALAIREKVRGSEHPDVGQSLNNLGGLYSAQGRYQQAEPLYRHALIIAEKALGPEHHEVATSLNNLALLLWAEGRYSETEPLYQRALAIFEKTLGQEHQDVAQVLNNLAALDWAQGRYDAAVPRMQRSLAIREKVLGPDHPDVGQSLSNLAELYRTEGLYSEAEPLYKRALAVREKALGPEHADVGQSLNNLAELYRAQGRNSEAEPLMERALTLTEKALGRDHPDVALRLNNLALLYWAEDRTNEAEALFGRARDIFEKALGPDHPNVGIALNNLAEFYRSQGRNSEAEPLMQRALALTEKALGPNHPDVAIRLNNLALLYWTEGRIAEAELAYQRALALFETALGPDHPSVATALDNLATLAFLQRQWRTAADYWRLSTRLITRRTRRGVDTVGHALTGQGRSEATQSSWQFSGLVKAMHRLASDGQDAARGLAEEAFQTAQWAQGSEAAASLAKMTARGTNDDPELASVVRERQDLVSEWRKKDRERTAAASQAPENRDRAREAINAGRLAGIDVRIAEIDRHLKAEFPDYAALAHPDPLGVEAVQAELQTDEALILFLDTDDRFMPTREETLVWVVTKTDMHWISSALGTKALGEHVAALRCGLDATLWADAASAKRCRAALGAEPRTERVRDSGKDEETQVLPFDLVRAHRLYGALLGPIADMIKGRHLLIVPSGPLTSLPFDVLVKEPPRSAVPETLAHYREAAWLGALNAITVLPSVASLKGLRRFARTSRASRPYLGIGNPLLEGKQDDPDWGTYYQQQAALARMKNCSEAPSGQQMASARGPRSVRGMASLFRGAQADIEQIRAWSPLPETADELCEVARRLSSPQADILLGANATETRLKELSAQGRLADYAIIHFATHGALTGQVQGSAEPGLILTPPPRGTSDAQALARDDGFLTASEIATLRLDADWVILSACNTAGAQSEHAEALSGMAQAFFYAGARALLVSHWEVASNAAVKLTTRTFAELQAHPKIGRAEALRLAMKEVIEEGAPAEAHPSQWAPFVVVGVGAASNEQQFR